MYDEDLVDTDKVYVVPDEISAYDMYRVLCKHFSFEKMVELYGLIDHKMKYLYDEPRETSMMTRGE